MKMHIFLTILLGLAGLNVFAQNDYLPSTIFLTDSTYTHHVLVVEKSSHSLFLFENANGVPKLVKKFNSATGKFKGDKFVQGDRKTPEGIYILNEFFSSQELVAKHGEYGKIYGAGAFTTNYPNTIDTRNGKAGGGIWLHSTDDNSRVSKGLDSRGCVVVIDNDLKEISEFIDLKHTPMIIVQDLQFLTKEVWEKNKSDIINVVQTWIKAWSEKDFENYINSYSNKEFISESKGRLPAYKAYKKAVFSRKDNPQINIDNLSVLHNGEYVIVQMQQHYSSDIINDSGKKTLYLKKDDDYNWKIVSEGFTKIESKDRLAFIPSKRFFKEEEANKQ